MSFYAILWAQITLIIKGIQFCFSPQFYKVSMIYFKRKSEYIPIRMAKMQNNINTKCWWRWEAKWTLILCWWWYKMAQPLWKMIWKFLTRVNIPLLYNLATVLCFPKKVENLYPYKNCVHVLSYNSQSLLKLMSIVLVMPSNHLILLSPFPTTCNLSQHQGLL